MGELKRIGRNISRPVRQVSRGVNRFSQQAQAQAQRAARQVQAQAKRAADQAKAQAQRAAQQVEANARRATRQAADQAGRMAKQANPTRALKNLAIRPAASVAKAVGAKSFASGLKSENPWKAAASLASMSSPVALIAGSSLPGLRGTTNRLMKKGIGDSERMTGLKMPSIIADNPARAVRFAGAAAGLGGLALGGGAGLFGPQQALGAANQAPGTQFSLYQSPAGGYGAEVGAQNVGAGVGGLGPGSTFGQSAFAELPFTGITDSYLPAAAKGAAPYSVKLGGGALGGGGAGGLFGTSLSLGDAAMYGGLGYLGYSLLKPQDKVPQMQALPALPPEEPFSMPGGAYIDSGAAMPYAEDIAGLAGDMQGLGQQQIADYNAQFRPLLSQYAGLAANGYDGDYYANRASADVASQFSQAQAEQQRGLSRYGLNPNSPAFQSQMYDLALAQAAAEAGTRTDARQWAADASRQALGQGVQFGQGLFSSGLNALGGAANTYNGLNNDYTQIAGANANTAASAYQNAYQAQSDYQQQLYQAQLQNQQNAYQNQMNQYSANQQNNNALLGLAGTLTGAWLFG